MCEDLELYVINCKSKLVDADIFQDRYYTLCTSGEIVDEYQYFLACTTYFYEYHWILRTKFDIYVFHYSKHVATVYIQYTVSRFLVPF